MLGEKEVTPDKDGRYTVTDLETDTSYDITVICKISGGEEFSYKQMVSTVAGIDNIMTEKADTTVAGYYDMLGRKSATPHRGVNIVRYSDGTTRKVFMK